MFLNEETDRVPACAPVKRPLADKLSGLLKQAIEDARAVEKLPGYVLSMNSWHDTDGTGTCYVCMAGAVMARSFGVSARRNGWNELRKRADLSNQDNAKLLAIDDMRLGYFSEAQRRISGMSPRLIPGNVAFAEARRVVRDGWEDGLGRATWDAYLRAADILEAAGY